MLARNQTKKPHVTFKPLRLWYKRDLIIVIVYQKFYIHFFKYLWGRKL